MFNRRYILLASYALRNTISLGVFVSQVKRMKDPAYDSIRPWVIPFEGRMVGFTRGGKVCKFS